MRVLMSYLPENYRASRETAAFQNALQPEADGLWDARDDLLAQLDPFTATWGLELWEKALGLPPGAGLTLELRRRQMVAKLQGRGPTTAETLKNVAETLLGAEVSVVEHFSQYLVELVVEDGWQAPIGDSAARLRLQLLEMLPAHLDFQVVLPLLLPLPITPTLGPRCGRPQLPPFRGALKPVPLYITAFPGGYAASTIWVPPKRTPLGTPPPSVGLRLGPRLSRSRVWHRAARGVATVRTALGGRMSTAAPPEYKGG